MHRIIETSYGEVLVDINGDCYIGDNYDDYIGSIHVWSLVHETEKSLVRKFENMMANY